MNQSATARTGRRLIVHSFRATASKVPRFSIAPVRTSARSTASRSTVPPGRVAYAVSEFGGFLGMGGHEYTIPWGKLTYDPEKHGFSTDLTKEQLEGAPAGGRRDSYRASAGGVGTGRRPGRTRPRPIPSHPSATTRMSTTMVRGTATANASSTTITSSDIIGDD